MTQYNYSYQELDALFSGHRTLSEINERYLLLEAWATEHLQPAAKTRPHRPEHPRRDEPPPEPAQRRYQPPSAIEPEPPANSNGVRVCACDRPMLQLQWTGFDRRLTASCLKCGRDAEQPADRRFDPDDAPSRELRSMAMNNRGLRYV